MWVRGFWVCLLGLVLGWAACSYVPQSGSIPARFCQDDADCPEQSYCQGGTCLRVGGGREVSSGEGPQEPTAPDLPPADGACTDGQKRPCYSYDSKKGGIGPCTIGVRTCKDSAWGPCVGDVAPSPEICDNVDNDCDGQIDEGFKGPQDVSLGQPCSKGQGICRQTGIVICAPDHLSALCNAPEPSAAKAEECNGKDDDCDGTIDEDIQGLASCDYPGAQGPCRRGQKECKGGLVVCVQLQPPVAELCNGKDDDCDGQTDEDFTSVGQPCSLGQGLCLSQGKITCSPDQRQVLCDAIPGTPSAEICDGKDNDCDGQLDEGCSCVSDTDSRACYSAAPKGCQATATGFDCKAPCKAGIQPCVKGQWGPCVGAIEPKAEECNGKDDDCNGIIDDGKLGGKACTDNSKRGECMIGREICQQGNLRCASIATPQQEICDGKDNDCDGNIDNGIQIPNDSLQCSVPGKLGPCRAGENKCQGGKITCVSTYTPTSDDKCNGIDDNCDGTLDDKDPQVGKSCTTTQKGECGKGRTICEQGKLLCQTQHKPTNESCNGKDDDCDGQTDEWVWCGGIDMRCHRGRCECRPNSVRCAKGNSELQRCTANSQGQYNYTRIRTCTRRSCYFNLLPPGWVCR